jgi:Tannase and feruloyl esterase
VARNYLRRFSDMPDPPKSLADLDFATHAVRLAPVDALPSFGANGKRMAGFQESGGKLLLYHSWSDDSLTPATAIDVYTAHERAMGGKDKIDDFFRLFVIPGVFHCRGGDGPDAVDFLSAMENWVEKKSAPDKLIALKPTRTIPLPGEYRFPVPAVDMVFSRPVFPYPASAKYVGRGDAKDAANWVRN